METKDGKGQEIERTPEAGVRKPYVKPAFRYEKVFETRALSCGKINASQMQCQTNTKNS